jgi:hypothetical protein
MKVGDLVKYCDDHDGHVEDDIGMIVEMQFIGDREIVSVLWHNGVWEDDSCEFMVVS